MPRAKMRGEHDGVEEADGEDAPHGDVAEGEHGEQDQQAGDEGGAAEDDAGGVAARTAEPMKRPTMAPPQ